MRMPILSYFLVVGSVLMGLLVWASNAIGSTGSLKVSQMVGLPAPFKAPPDEALPRISTVNFAAEHPTTKSIQALEMSSQQGQRGRPSKSPVGAWEVSGRQLERLMK